jgi:hypothetical protein
MPDAPTRDRLARRYAWSLLSLLVLSAVSGLLIFLAWVTAPEIQFDVDLFDLFVAILAVAAIVTAAGQMLTWAIVCVPARGLPRASRRAHWDGLIARAADSTPEDLLLLMVGACEAFALGGLFTAAVGTVKIGLLKAALFGAFCVALWGTPALMFWQSLRHKRVSRRPS